MAIKIQLIASFREDVPWNVLNSLIFFMSVISLFMLCDNYRSIYLVELTQHIFNEHNIYYNQEGSYTERSHDTGQKGQYGDQ